MNDEKASKRFEALEQMQAKLVVGNGSSRGSAVPASASPSASPESQAKRGKLVPISSSWYRA